MRYFGTGYLEIGRPFWVCFGKNESLLFLFKRTAVAETNFDLEQILNLVHLWLSPIQQFWQDVSFSMQDEAVQATNWLLLVRHCLVWLFFDQSWACVSVWTSKCPCWKHKSNPHTCKKLDSLCRAGQGWWCMRVWIPWLMQLVTGQGIVSMHWLCVAQYSGLRGGLQYRLTSHRPGLDYFYSPTLPRVRATSFWLLHYCFQGIKHTRPDVSRIMGGNCALG